MGWLEVQYSFAKFVPFANFNSTMGWLEVLTKPCKHLLKEISIPLWDDWKFMIRRRISAFRLFQFHYGMIGRLSATLRPVWTSNFNSTMGWLEVAGAFFGVGDIHISIPLWDDWKLESWCLKWRMFFISIPLWDDWKLQGIGVSSW